MSLAEEEVEGGEVGGGIDVRRGGGGGERGMGDGVGRCQGDFYKGAGDQKG